MPDSLLRFFGTVLLLLVGTFIVWYVAIPYLIAPLAWLMNLVSQWFFPGHVVAVQLAQDGWSVLTSLSPVDNPVSLARFSLDPVRATIGFPFLWALVLATPGARRLKNLFVGSLVLVPLSIILLVPYIFNELLVMVGPQHTIGRPLADSYLLGLPYSETQAVVISLSLRISQIAVLVFPILIWIGLNKSFLASLFGEKQWKTVQAVGDYGLARIANEWKYPVLLGVLILALFGADQQRRKYNQSLAQITSGKIESGVQQLLQIAAADPGQARLRLGLIIGEGVFSEPDLIRALQLIQTAAADGDFAAQFYLGHLYETGKWLQRNPTQAINWYEQAAIQGFPHAQYKTAMMYASGDELQANETSAVNWMYTAGLSGHKQALLSMARWHEEGAQGLPKDLGKAQEFRQAAQPAQQWQTR